MKIEFTEEEVTALPKAIRQKLDGNTFEGSPDGIVEDTQGLKSALQKEREDARDKSKKLKDITEKLGDNNIDDLLTLRGTQTELLRSNAKSKIIQDIAAAGGNAHILIDKMMNEIAIDEKTGEITIPGTDGVALQREDGTAKDHTDVLTDWKSLDTFAGTFAATRQSGTGGLDSDDGGDRNDKPTDAPPKSLRVSEMSTEQKVAAVKEHGSLEGYRI